MTWIVRRVLVPFVVGSAVCAVLLLAWGIWGSDTEVRLGIRDYALAALFILPFQAIGVCLLVPIALFLGDLSLPRAGYPMLLSVVGAALGTVVILPISDRPSFFELTLPAICGALSALIWLAFNRDTIKRRS